MTYTDADLAMAQRHVLEGQDRVGRQQALIARLRLQDHPTATAEQLLGLFEATLDDMTRHLAVIRTARGDPLPYP